MNVGRRFIGWCLIAAGAAFIIGPALGGPISSAHALIGAAPILIGVALVCRQILAEQRSQRQQPPW